MAGETPDLTLVELKRYARHLAIPDFGVESQKKLKAAKVLVVGAGGLGSPMLLYLAAAGVGHIGIVDFDTVAESNLQRQVLYGVDDVGQSKAQLAKKRLQTLNPHCKVTVHETQLTSENAETILSSYDIVADGTDNFPTRYLVNDACVLFNKINVYASIFRFEGQVAVFNNKRADGSRGPNYRDIFPTPPPPGLVPNCAEGGVLGVLPGIVGSMQANEVIKIITGIGEPLDGKLFLFDAASFETRTLKIPKNPATRISELIDYEVFCGYKGEKSVPEISVQELRTLLEEQEDFQLIDVREPYEFEIANLGGELMPKAELPKAVAKISRAKKVVLHCRSGQRSAEAVQLLQEQFGFTNLYNLKGGILAWAEEIDTSMPTY